jgi:hypothetical protein
MFRGLDSLGRFDSWGKPGRAFAMLTVVAGCGLAGCGLAGCSGDAVSESPSARRGSPPPPAASQASGKAVACSRSAIDDAVSKGFFPASIEGFCLDPAEGGKAMGKDAPRPLEGMCDLFDGECQVYETFGVERVVQLHYVAQAGGGATLDVIASRFASPEGAYGMFTKRVVGDGDPKDPATPKATEGGGAAVLGMGNAYLWRGAWLVELTANDASATPAALEALGAKTLPPLVKAIGSALPGDVAPPAAVAALPTEGRVAMGVRFLPDSVLASAQGFGPGAVGYYEDGTRRYRVIAAPRSDEAKAKASMDALRKLPGAAAETGLGDEAARVTMKEGALEWELVVARKGASVVGVSDEPRAMRAGMPAEERTKLCLPASDKSARLAKLVGGAGGRTNQ